MCCPIQFNVCVRPHFRLQPVDWVRDWVFTFVNTHECPTAPVRTCLCLHPEMPPRVRTTPLFSVLDLLQGLVVLCQPALQRLFDHCETFTCTLVSSVTVSALQLRTLPQGPWVSSKSVFLHQPSHRVTQISTLRTHPTLVAEQVAAHFVNPRFAARGHCTAAEDASLLQAAAEREEIYLRPSDPSLVQFLGGAVASSAVSSVLYLRDAAGNHAETRTGACTHCGDAASFHEWEPHSIIHR